jgi:hypothetical protein
MNTLLTAAPHIHPHATLAVGDACLVYQGLLVNSYCTSDLCRLPGLARPPSASCDWRAFGHSTMSDPADAWFPRPRTPPALSRHKDQRAYCASRTHTDATIPGAQLMQATRGATSERSSCNLRTIMGQPQPPSFLLMTMPGWTFINVYTHDRDLHDPAIEGLQGG